MGPECISTDVALDIFALPYNFTGEQLRSAYKHVSLAAHPDRGGTADIFAVVRGCYEHLERELEYRQGARSHFDLRDDSRGYQPPPPTNATPQGRFDLAQFNSVFDQTSVADPVYSRGYGNLEDCGRNAPSIPATQSAEAFNRAFCEAAGPPPQRAIAVHPASYAATARLQFTWVWMRSTILQLIPEFLLDMTVD
eukprot:scaffold4161_cov22-Prasinocladus_malaysianus.AAC.5